MSIVGFGVKEFPRCSIFSPSRCCSTRRYLVVVLADGAIQHMISEITSKASSGVLGLLDS